VTKHVKLKAALGTVKKAIDVRAQISEIYKQYDGLAKSATLSAEIPRSDFKRAVDAIHYLGGGWPSENTKGRMESLLDNFAGMYRVLDFIGRGDMVTNHLIAHGITIQMDPAMAIQDAPLAPNDVLLLNREYNLMAFGIYHPKTVRELVSQLVDAAEMLQTDICKLADMIKDDLRPNAQKELGVTDEEYDRLHDIVKFSAAGTVKGKDKAKEKKVEVADSVHNYNEALGLVPTV
jgi:hypothetical protein